MCVCVCEKKQKILKQKEKLSCLVYVNFFQFSFKEIILCLMFEKRKEEEEKVNNSYHPGHR